MNLDRTVFFKALRSIFDGSLTQPQVDGVNALLEAWVKYGDGDNRKLADILGQVKRETGGVMSPIHELGGDAYFAKYGKGTLAQQLGNESVADGIKYHGRGPIMITGRNNYTKFSQILGIDLVNDPDKALDPTIGAQIAVIGTMKGVFTGKKLGDYFNGSKTDWQNARRVVNGMDHADEVATSAKQFYAAILASITPDADTNVGDLVPPPEPPAPPAASRPTTWLQGGSVGTVSLVGLKAALDASNESVTQVHDTAGQVVDTIHTVRDTASGLGSWMPSPAVIAVLCGCIAVAGLVTLYLRHRLAKEQGV